jgi:hypothetical protein
MVVKKDIRTGEVYRFHADPVAGFNLDVNGQHFVFYDIGDGKLVDPLRQVMVFGGVVRILDSHPAFLAYSVRLLSSTYLGPCLRIRRSSDNAEQDIYFVNGWVDTAAILSFCGAGSGFVVTWYDQTGNGRHATQSTAGDQPQICSSGAILLENGIVTLVKQDVNTCLTWTDFTPYAQPSSYFGVGIAGSNGTFYDGVQVGTSQRLFNQLNNLQMWSGAPILSTGTDYGVPQILFSTLHNGASSVIRVNGSEEASGSSGSNGRTGIQVMSAYDCTKACDKAQELIVYNSDKTANTAEIEENIAAETTGFNITLAA